MMERKGVKGIGAEIAVEEMSIGKGPRRKFEEIKKKEHKRMTLD